LPTSPGLKRSVIKLSSLLNLFNTTLIPDLYTIGIALAAGPEDKVNITGDGGACPFGEVYNGTACLQPLGVTPGNEVNGTLEMNLVHIYGFDVRGMNNMLPKTLEITNLKGSVQYYVRYGGSPSFSIYDKSGVNITIPFPRLGRWYVLVRTSTSAKRQAAIEYSFISKIVLCSGNDSCANVTEAKPNTFSLVENVPVSTWTYYKFQSVYPGDPFWVSLAATGIRPDVYVSLGQLPTEFSYDAKNCNQPHCDYSTIIKLNDSSSPTVRANSTYYIGVLSPNVTSYGIWFSSACAPLCASHGECVSSGPSTGKCTCAASWTSYDCSIEVDTGLPAQYIVLIIIASLVVASAFIGFIAWAYMQKKRQGYVKVKD